MGLNRKFVKTVYIFEINRATEVESDTKVAINKNSDTVQKLFPLGEDSAATHIFSNF